MRSSSPRLALVLFLTILLSGCAGIAPAPTSSPESSGTTPEASSSQPESSPNEQLTETSVLEVIERSYLRFEAEGMTERVESDGESFVLLFDPKQPDYQAAWFNLDTGESELIFETDYFTLFVAYLMLDVPGHEIELVPGGFVLSAPEWNPIEYTVKGGLLTGAKGVEFDWDATFEYGVHQELVPKLEALAQQLIDSFD